MKYSNIFTLSLMVSLAILLLPGCSQPSAPAPGGSEANAGGSDAETETPDEKTAEGPKDESPEEVKLEVKSWEEVQAWVKSQQGKIVVVDVWSTSCPPCIAEFPNFVALQKKYPEEVACASFSLDYIGSDHDPSEELKTQIQAALQKLNAGPTVNFLSSDSDEEATKMMEVAAIPVAFVYDKAGELAKKFTNDEGEYPGEGYTYKDHIVPLVDKLVKDEASE